MSDNKCSLDNMLKAVLAPANQEQNAFYPPYIYEQHYNTATSWLISKIVEIFPTSQQFVDIIEPFLETKQLLIKGGYVEIPTDCRNFLDAAINVKGDLSGECKDDLPKGVLEQQFINEQKKGKCLSRPIIIVDQTQWDLLTKHPYQAPTYEYPIGCFFGKGKLKVCPFDISTVEVRYIRNEKIYKYGYITQPDETYIFDEKTTIESEWNTNAFEYLYKALISLYSVWCRDNTLRNWSVELKQLGLT